MTVWSISSNKNAPATSDGLPSGVDNDKGTIRGAGTGLVSAKWNLDSYVLGPTYFRTVISGVNGVRNCTAAGAFNSGDYVIRRVTTDIGGVTNNALLYGSNSSNASNAINQARQVSTYYYKSAIRAGYWNKWSGVWTTDVSVGATGAWSQRTDTDVSSELASSGVDIAAAPSGARPGHITFRAGAPKPTGKYYAAKTLY